MQEDEGGELGTIPADPPDDRFKAPNPGIYCLLVDANALASAEVTIKVHFPFLIVKIYGMI